MSKVESGFSSTTRSGVGCSTGGGRPRLRARVQQRDESESDSVGIMRNYSYPPLRRLWTWPPTDRPTASVGDDAVQGTKFKV